MERGGGQRGQRGGGRGQSAAGLPGLWSRRALPKTGPEKVGEREGR